MEKGVFQDKKFQIMQGLKLYKCIRKVSYFKREKESQREEERTLTLGPGGPWGPCGPFLPGAP